MDGNRQQLAPFGLAYSIAADAFQDVPPLTDKGRIVTDSLLVAHSSSLRSILVGTDPLQDGLENGLPRGGSQSREEQPETEQGVASKVGQESPTASEEDVLV